MQIYLARNNQQAGPYSLEQVNQMLASQQVLLTDLAWHEGMREWKSLGELTQGQLVYTPAHLKNSGDATALGASQNNNSTIQSIDVQRVIPATVGSRIAAKLVDIGLFIVPQIALLLMFVPLSMFEQQTHLSMQEQIKLAEQIQHSMPSWVPIFIVCYTLTLLVIQNVLIGRSGQSIGKKIFKLQIVDAINFKLAGQFRAFFVRSFLFVVLSQLLGIFPFLIMIFIADIVLFLSNGNNSLHDRLAKTKVIQLPK